MSELIKIDGFSALTAVSDFKAVKSIQLNYIAESEIKRHAPLLRKCSNLKELSFYQGSYFYDLPSIIFELSSLESLTIKNSRISVIPSSIARLENLKTLVLNNLYLNHFPSEIGYLSNLEELDLTSTNINDNLEDLEDLTKLTHLNLFKTKIKKLSPKILELPSLQELILPLTLKKKIIAQNPTISNAFSYFFQHSTLEKKYLNKLLNYCRSQQLSFRQRAIILNMMAEDRSKLDSIASMEEILAITDITKQETLRFKALEYYTERWGKEIQASISAHTHLCVQGKLSMSKKELQQKLKTHDIKYSARISNKTTHFLVGQLPHQSYLEALEKKIPVVTETMILKFLNDNTEQYLVDEIDNSPEYISNISALLLSGQEDNFALAFELFKQGGFPPTLLTELFIAYKELDNNKILESQATELIHHYGSITLIDLIKKKSQLFYPYSSEGFFISKLNFIHKHTELNAEKISNYAYVRYKKGLSFLLKRVDTKRRSTILSELVNQGVLNLSARELSSIPKEIFSLNNITQLDLSNNRLGTASIKEFKKLGNLKSVRFYGNTKLWQKKDKILKDFKTEMPWVKVYL